MATPMNPATSAYMVNGTAFVYTGTGAAGALETLGYTVDGVNQNITENKGEIITDLFGPMTPQDYQDLGMVAKITCPFIAMDRAVLAKVMNRGDRTGAIGALSTPGLVLGVSGYAFRLAIASTFDSPWSFNSCILATESTRLGTRANPMQLDFNAWPFVSYTAVTGRDARLWTRSLTLQKSRTGWRQFMTRMWRPTPRKTIVDFRGASTRGLY